jgi:hypothetical protein
VKFDSVIHTTNGFVSGINLSNNLLPIIFDAKINIGQDNYIDVNTFHEIIGHFGVEKLQEQAKIHVLKLTGRVKLCQDCTIAKPRQKIFDKEWN